MKEKLHKCSFYGIICPTIGVFSMFKEEFREVGRSNKLEPICDIRMMDIFKYCVDDSEQMLNNFRGIRDSYRTRINYMLDYNKLNDDFFNTLKIYSDSEHFIGLFRLNKDEFIIKLQKFLNTGTEITDYDSKELDKVLKEKITKLEMIGSLDELQKEFPLIFDDYNKGIDMYNKYSLLDFMDDNDERKQQLLNLKRYYYNCGLRFSLPHFIKEQVKLYSNFAKKRDKVRNYCEHSALSYQMFDGINQEKLELFLCDSYIKKMETSNNLDEIFLLVKMCEDYFIKTVHTDKVLVMEDRKVSYNGLVKRYRNVLRKYNIESKCFVNWEIIPEGEDLDRVHQVSEPRSFKELSEEELNKLRTANRRKIDFFNNSYYLGRALGDSYFRGYIAFFYPNGEVLMDTLVDDSNIKGAIGDAMYNVSIYDFVELSKLDKKTLRSTGRATKIVHRGAWEEKAKAIISKPASEKSVDDTKKLIKSLQ